MYPAFVMPQAAARRRPWLTARSMARRPRMAHPAAAHAQPGASVIGLSVTL